MEDVSLIIDIIFKIAVMINVIVTTFIIKDLRTSLSNLWDLVIKQARYISDTQKELKELKEKKTKKKVEKKEDKHE